MCSVSSRFLANSDELGRNRLWNLRRTLSFLATSGFVLASLGPARVCAQTVAATVTVEGQPDAIAVDSVTNKIYVANLVSNGVTVIDGSTNTTTSLPLGTPPNSAIAVNSLTNQIYVTNSAPAFTNGSVTVIDGATNASTNVVAGFVPGTIAVNSVTDTVYVGNLGLAGGSTVTVINGTTNAATTVAVGNQPTAIAVNSVTNQIYVASSPVTVIDGATNKTTSVTAGTFPYAVAVNPVTNQIYVANNESNTVTVIDGTSNATTTVQTGNSPSAIAVNATTNKIYVVNYNSNTVTVIDGSTKATTTVAVGSEPDAIAVNSVTNQVYVANNFADSVTVIDGATNATSNIAVGSAPVAIAVNSITNTIYVANNGNSVTVISGGGAAPAPTPVNVTGLSMTPMSPLSLSMPTSTAALSLFPQPNALATSLSTFYTSNSSSFDSQTQTFLNTEVIKLGQWLNANKTSTVSNAFLNTANAITDVTNAISIENAIEGLSDFSNMSGADQAYFVVSTEHDIANGLGISFGAVDTLFPYISATKDAITALAVTGDATVAPLLSLDTTIWADWVVPQLREYGQDPVDPNYKVLVIPTRIVFGSLPSSGDSQFDGLLMAELQSSTDLGMYMHAANQTLDKYSGALNAGDTLYATLQIEAFLSFMDDYNQTAQAAAAEIQSLGTYLSGKGYTASNQNPALLTNIQQQISQSGFNQTVLNYLQALGYTPDQVTQARQVFLSLTPSSIPTDPGLQTQIVGSAVNATSTSANSTARLVNISTRAQVGTGGNILIPGFVISGSGTETLLIRADGPALTGFGVSGALAQPSLSVFDSSGAMIASNTGWGTGTNPGQIASTATSVGAFALASGSADCALVASLPAGAYTVQVSGVNNSTGVALAEVYEVSASGTRLVNISTRAQVGTGADIIIPGFVISGSGTEQLLVRADGPALSTFGVGGILAQPSLSVFNNSGTVIASNTGWGTSPNPAQIASTASSVGAFALTSASADSAQIVNLSAGAYTMQISGANNSTGVALAELYEVP
jgi:YVTN family beta-propeller protein